MRSHAFLARVTYEITALVVLKYLVVVAEKDVEAEHQISLSFEQIRHLRHSAHFINVFAVEVL